MAPSSSPRFNNLAPPRQAIAKTSSGWSTMASSRPTFCNNAVALQASNMS